MIKINITRNKIDPELVVHSNGKQYLNCILFENDKPDQYGNDGIIKQEATKEEREKRKASGKLIPIIGNWKWMNKPKTDAAPNPAAATQPDDDSGAPF